MTLIFKTDGRCSADKDTRQQYIRSALEKGFKEFAPPEVPFQGACDIVASGPSVMTQLDKLGQRFTIAVSKAHDFLIDHGINPQVSFCIDPTKNVLTNYEHKKRFIKYYLASQTHPDVLNEFEGYDVTLVHMLGKSERTFPELKGKFLLGGGSTSGLRAMSFAYLLGFRELHLYGFDSCYASAGGKVVRNVNRLAGPERLISGVEGSDKRFVTDGAMAQQADEFRETLKTGIFHDAEIHAHGDGLIQECLRMWKCAA